jgi:outer membrane lipoprotein-sorting protein
VKKLGIIILILASSFSGMSQGKANEAEKLLEKISKRYKAFKTIKADFTYTLENKQEKSQEKQKGQILIKGNKFRLDIANQLIICDNKTVWTFSREINEVAIKLDDIFTMYGKGFLYKQIESKKDGNKELVLIELTPKDKKKKYFKIKVWVDKTNQTILSSQVFDKNGSIHTYTVNNQVPNLIFQDNQFVFDVKKFPGCEVVDLR